MASFERAGGLGTPVGGNVGHSGADRSWGKEALTVAQWSPLVDITEDEKKYLIKAELPGMKKEDVRLTVEHEVLAMSGERTFEKEEKGKKYHRIERASLMKSPVLISSKNNNQATRKFLTIFLPIKKF